MEARHAVAVRAAGRELWAGFGAGTPQQDHFENSQEFEKWSPGGTQDFQELKICGHGTVLALYRCAQNASSTNVSELLRRAKRNRRFSLLMDMFHLCSERSSYPCLCSGVVWLAHRKCEVMAQVSRSDGLWRIQGSVWRKHNAVWIPCHTSFKHKNNTLKLYCQQL